MIETGSQYWLMGLAAVAAGAINALAGGGTLITFPTLIALGVPPITANVTNTVALCPGFIGGILAQFKDLAGQKRRFWIFLGISAVGGMTGSILPRKRTACLFPHPSCIHRPGPLFWSAWQQFTEAISASP